jgi:hypothetical protein
MSSFSTDRNDYPQEMYDQLGELCFNRYHSALAEGKTERQAFAEIVHVILDTYREALAS